MFRVSKMLDQKVKLESEEIDEFYQFMNWVMRENKTRQLKKLPRFLIHVKTSFLAPFLTPPLPPKKWSNNKVNESKLENVCKSEKKER